MVKKLIIVYTANQIEKNLSLIKNLVLSGNSVLITLDFETQRYLEKLGVPFNSVRQYIDSNTFNDIDIDATKLARSWHNSPSLNKLVTYEDISLGKLIEYEMAFFFSTVLELINTLYIILKKETPREIIIFNDWHQRMDRISPNCYEDIPISILAQLAKNFKIPIKKIDVSVSVQKELTEDLKIKFKNISLKCLSFFIDTIKAEVNEDKKNILILDSWDNVETIFSNSNKYKLTFIGQDYPITKSLIKNKSKILLSHSIKFRKYDELVNRQTKKRIKDNLIERKKEWERIKKNVKFNLKFMYRNVDLWPFLEGRLDFLISDKFRSIFIIIEGTKSIINKENINLIVLHDDVLFDRKTVASIGQMMGVKSLVIQHGIICQPIGFLPLTADRIAVWGDQSYEWFISHGVESSRLVITGCPRFDKYVSDDAMKSVPIEYKKIISVVLACPWVSREVHFANTFLSYDDMIDLVQLCIEAINDIPNVQLIIKFHPVDTNIEFYKPLIEKLSKKEVLLLQRCNLKDLLVSCDFLVTFDSSLALEAMILGKIPIIINLENMHQLNNPYADLNISVKNKEELKACLKKFIGSVIERKGYQHDCEQFVLRNAYLQDGHASDRLLRFIDGLIN